MIKKIFNYISSNNLTNNENILKYILHFSHGLINDYLKYDFLDYGGHKFVYRNEKIVYKILPFFINKKNIKINLKDAVLNLLKISNSLLNHRQYFRWHYANLKLYDEFKTNYLLNEIFNEHYNVEFENVFYLNNIIFLILKLRYYDFVIPSYEQYNIFFENFGYRRFKNIFDLNRNKIYLTKGKMLTAHINEDDYLTPMYVNKYNKTVLFDVKNRFGGNLTIYKDIIFIYDCDIIQY